MKVWLRFRMSWLSLRHHSEDIPMDVVALETSPMRHEQQANPCIPNPKRLDMCGLKNPRDQRNRVESNLSPLRGLCSLPTHSRLMPRAIV